MLQFTVEASTPKQCMLQLIAYAKQVLEHDAQIDGCYMDDAELANADAEDAFEAIRTALRTASKLVDVDVA